MTNSADPDQLASIDLDLHCLQRQSLTEALLMSTHNICFHGEIKKYVPVPLLSMSIVKSLVSEYLGSVCYVAVCIWHEVFLVPILMFYGSFHIGPQINPQSLVA